MLPEVPAVAAYGGTVVILPYVEDRSPVELVDPPRGQPEVDVLIPTRDRPAALAVTLAGLSAQTLPGFRVVVSDQGDTEASGAPEVLSAVRLLRARGRPVELHRHLPRRGLAEHRQSLLDRARGGTRCSWTTTCCSSPTSWPGWCG